MMKNASYFILKEAYFKNINILKDIYIFVLTFWAGRKNDSIRKIWLV